MELLIGNKTAILWCRSSGSLLERQSPRTAFLYLASCSGMPMWRRKLSAFFRFTKRNRSHEATDCLMENYCNRSVVKRFAYPVSLELELREFERKPLGEREKVCYLRADRLGSDLNPLRLWSGDS